MKFCLVWQMLGGGVGIWETFELYRISLLFLSFVSQPTTVLFSYPQPSLITLKYFFKNKSYYIHTNCRQFSRNRKNIQNISKLLFLIKRFVLFWKKVEKQLLYHKLYLCFLLISTLLESIIFTLNKNLEMHTYTCKYNHIFI